jgi:hypothetical protein
MDFAGVGFGGGDFGVGGGSFNSDVGSAPVGGGQDAPAAAPTGFSDESSFEPAQRSRALPELNPSLTPSQQIETVRRSTLPEDLRGPADKPQAEYRTVPQDQQRLVDMEVKARLQSDVDARNLPADQRAKLQSAIDAVGTPDFYKQVAQLDPKNASAWNDMAGVQQGFKDGEPGYDPKTRAYSESMRLTLHAAAVEHLANPSARDGADLYSHFIRLHTTAFDQNGGWLTNNQLGLSGAKNVLTNTPLSMATNAHNLLYGTFQNTDQLTARAADVVRQSRWSVINGAFGAM